MTEFELDAATIFLELQYQEGQVLLLPTHLPTNKRQQQRTQRVKQNREA